MKLATLPQSVTPIRARDGLQIRPLTVDELPLCAPFGVAFMTEKQVPGTFSLEIFTKNWTMFLTQYPAIILGLWRGDRLIGGLGGMISPDLNTGEQIAIEFFWYVDADARHGTWPLRLLTRFRHWGAEHGAARLRMIHLLDLNESPSTVKLARVYAKLGLRPIEVGYDAPIQKGG